VTQVFVLQFPQTLIFFAARTSSSLASAGVNQT
jgi:hypothetical protein